MSAVRKVRLHYKDGKVVTEPLVRFAAANGLRTLADARGLIADWVGDGSLRLRPDGGYDVVRFRPRQAQSGPQDSATATVGAAAEVARLHAERGFDDHGPACRCGNCVEDLR